MGIRDFFKKKPSEAIMETRRVQAIHSIKDHPYYLDPGDVKNIPQDVANQWIENGWASDAITGEAVAPVIKNTSLAIDPIQINTSSRTK